MEASEARPVVTFDLDGVLCRPPFGINPGKGIGKRRDAPGKRGLLWRTERWRYYGRRPMPGAVEGMREIRAHYEVRVLSARGEVAREHTERWLRRWFGFVPEMHLRQDWHESPAAFKARKTSELGAIAHFEDDPHTAAWIAELLPAVFLVDWRRNRWLEASNVHRIRRLAEALPALSGLAAVRTKA